ncbi:protein of unknown function [Methylococcus capsulatus]|uniref:Uncharacterized protein n=1 Tax=Methylococcus capsulatus TaxID=414 RepID=A0AA35Y1C9_METCP|nr:protein of unknown function [Methylococcus capsulatus]
MCLLIQVDAIHGMTGTFPFTPPDRARFSAEGTGSPLDLNRRVDAERPRSGIGRSGTVGDTPAEAGRDPNVRSGERLRRDLTPAGAVSEPSRRSSGRRGGGGGRGISGAPSGKRVVRLDPTPASAKRAAGDRAMPQW